MIQMFCVWINLAYILIHKELLPSTMDNLCHVNFVFTNVYEWITLKIFQNYVC